MWILNRDLHGRSIQPQYPDYPQNGQRNVDLKQRLAWPQYPGATSYKVYVWPYNSTKPSSPKITTTSRFYNPASPYPPGTRMLWQVEYQTPSGTIPSPIWGFESRHYADFMVDSITVPPQAFSGQSMSVRWQVKNIGGLGSERSTWYDAIYIGTSTKLSDARRVKVVRKSMFLDPNDGYSSVTDISLRKDDLGSYYVFVTTDIYRNIVEVDRTNNILRSTSPVQVILTPPPNLIVETIQVSDSTFSGEKFQVRWTVKNDGTGATVENVWRDSVFMSQDSVLGLSVQLEVTLGFICILLSICPSIRDTRFDTLLTSKYHTGFLSPGDSYTESESVTCPNAIHGTYSIIVVTDIDNRVYEHSSDDDNTKVVEGALQVTLSPPPDLVVNSLRVNGETFHTGDAVVIDYTISNNGIGEPFERWWSDAVYLSQQPNGRRQLISSTTFSGSLKYGETYDRRVTYNIPVSLPSGNYDITVHTDAQNKVFEYQSDNNNEELRTVRFIQVKADLKMEKVSVETKSNSTAAYVSVRYTVKNIAMGRTFAAPWVDNIYISRSSDSNDRTRLPISRFTRSKDLPADAVYTANLEDIELPASFHGNLYVHVSADYYSRVLEDNRVNNVGVSGEFNSPAVLPDLKPVQNKFQLLTTDSVYGGEEVTVKWEIQNGGNRNIASKRWTDSVFLSVSDVYDITALKLHDEKISMDVTASTTYSVTATFKLPENSFGFYKLLLLTDVTDSVTESDEANNGAALSLKISSVPSPDLTVTDIRFVLEQKSQFLRVTWVTSNHGNSMKVKRHWCDDVILSREKNVLSGANSRKIGTKCLSVNLNAQQELTNSESFLVPSGLEGKYWLHVITDARKNILEVNAENNNIAIAPDQVDIPSQQTPQLEMKFRSSIPTDLQAGDSVPIDVLVDNKDDRGIAATSWTDGLYFYHKAGATRSEVIENGLLIKTFIHNGGLSSGDSYSVKANVRIPYTAPRNGHLYFITDINGRTGGESFVVSGPAAVTIGDLPDLVPSFSSFQTVLKSGQPYDIPFSIENQGNSSISLVSAYITLYLSRDVLIDPFDIKLKSRQTTLTMNAQGGTQDVTSNVFIPYDLVSGAYYIIVKVDSRNEVYESDEMNNEAHVLVTLKEMPSTDIEVREVTLSDVSLEFNEEFNINWKVRNLGALTAEGYKCDSIYFSEDDKWDIKDVQVESAKCRNIKLKPYVDGAFTDNTYSDSALRLKTPLLAKHEYKGLVRLRSNIRELNLNNNVGVSAIGVNITFPIINVASTKTFGISGNSEKAFIIPNVDPEETLVVLLKSLNGKGIHHMYLRRDEPATGYLYDAASKTPYSSNQNLIAPNTQEGDYYLLVENTDTETSSVEVTVKLAKFEVIETSPKKAAPIGDVTVKLEGTLFADVLNASLVERSQSGNKNMITATRVYRFSSIEVYATFDLTSATVGQEYDIELLDVRKSAVAKFQKVLAIVKGIKGTLKVSGKIPRAMRPMETGTVTIDYRNTGFTDVHGGILLISSTGIGELQLMERGEPISLFGSSHMILAAPMNGPAGVLSPQSYGRIRIHVQQKQSSEIGRMPLKVSVVNGNEEPHPYIGEGERLKPSFVSDSAWEQTWKNCLKIVGSTWLSFSERLSEIGSQLSVAGRGVVTVETMFNYVLRVGDGAITGDDLVSFVDIENRAGSQSLPLHVQRIYSQMISKRRTVGMFGVGWTSPLWEMRILKHTDDTVSVLSNREELVLTAGQDGVYKDAGGNEVKVDRKEIHFFEVATSRTFTFDVDSKELRKITSASSDEITVERSSGKIVKVKSAKDGKMSFAYNADGYVRTVEIHDAQGKMVEFSLYEYHPEQKSHLTSVTKGANSVQYTYTDSGDLESVVYANGRRTEFKYDSNYWLSETAGYSTSGELMSSIQYQTDYNGKLTVTENPRQTKSEYLYDENLNVASMLGDDGVSVKYIRSRQTGRTILHGDQVLLHDKFDLATNMRSLKDGNGNKLQVEYDGDGQITNVTDGRGNRYQSTFKDGRLTSVIYPDMTDEKFVYDDKGKVVKQIVRNGGHIEFNYDDKQYLIGKTTSTDSTFLTYSDEGYLSEAQNNAGVVKVDYNDIGLPTKVQLPGGKQLHYGYNKASQRTYLRDETGDYNITYDYNNKDQLVSVKQNGAPMLKLDYEKGFLKKRTLGNSAYTEYRYNLKSGLLLSLHNYHPNGTLVDKFEYEYDSRWRRVSMTTMKGTWKYRYDAASQLTQFEDPSGKVVRFQYDRSKNRVLEQTGNTKMGYSVNSLNQYEGVGDVTYTYDKNGNVREKIVSGIVQEVFVYDDSNRLIESQTDIDRCQYVYDAMGNLYKKNCSASGVTTFIVDPFGLQGISNVIGQMSGTETTYFVHAEDQGLIAMLDHQGDQLFYQFDSQGSVTALMHGNGSLANTYSYDPFGKLLQAEETKRNDFCFVGQWGVRREKEVPGKYQMRARYYDSKLGRFVSPDPLGLPGPGLKNVNLYTYAENNPVTFADPQGRILPAIIAAGAAIGAITNGVIYTGTSLATGSFSWGGLGGAVVSGGITGAGITIGGAYSTLAGAGIAIGAGLAGGFAGSAVQQGIDSQSFNLGKAFADSAWSGATAWLPWKFFGYHGNVGATAWGNPYAWRNMNFGKVFRRAFGGWGLKTPRALWSSLGLGNFIGNLAPLVPDWSKNLWNCCLGDLWDDFLSWIRSRDPNDILGPAGYGDAHFIPADLELEYTIRFENDENATAPAQKVFVVHELDSDLEIRTFRVGSFGFGNFTREIENGRPILQETVDLSDTEGIAVRVRAGIDIINGLATWELQTLDPATGQPPTDPSVGFLPPNNGTTGQGFVSFSVSPKKRVSHMATIDAEAKIIFDQNEPIDTPPIFNTIDSSAPSANLTLVDDLVKEGTLAVNINKFDNGSGVRSVDIYHKLTNDTVEPLLTGIQNDIAVLPLKPGGSYQILLVSQDYVGNQADFDLDDTTRYMTVDFPYVVVTCDGVNNCSGHGDCLQKNFCQCEPGYYGDDCSSDTPPPEPPLLEATSLAGTEDIPVVLSLSARLVNSTQETGDLTVEVYDIPEAVTFSKGRVTGQKVVLAQNEFGEVKMTTKPHFSGQVLLKVKAVLNRNGLKVSRGGVLSVDISPVADKPAVTVDKVCFDSKSPQMKLKFVPQLQDTDGSENITVSLTGIPVNVKWSSSLVKLINVSVVSGEKVEVTLTQSGAFSPFTLTLDVLSTENANGDVAKESKQIKMEKCKTGKGPTGSSTQMAPANSMFMLLCLIGWLVRFSST
ncbi:uncharacterized protein LOC121377841 [Gigantopelta aegis]|uniref:uncharacterized protein LOC121377841 n=1 Tax=Gigantopelta aegis TaxID=1735272 RepID=UPI001B8883E0|nr:uncharacterized protein LOC121377841 [Gigantopelta aegis]